MYLSIWIVWWSIVILTWLFCSFYSILSIAPNKVTDVELHHLLLVQRHLLFCFLLFFNSRWMLMTCLAFFFSLSYFFLLPPPPPNCLPSLHNLLSINQIIHQLCHQLCFGGNLASLLLLKLDHIVWWYHPVRVSPFLFHAPLFSLPAYMVSLPYYQYDWY